MAEISTIARPYAQAVFDLAKEQKQLPTSQRYPNQSRQQKQRFSWYVIAIFTHFAPKSQNLNMSHEK